MVENTYVNANLRERRVREYQKHMPTFPITRRPKTARLCVPLTTDLIAVRRHI